MSDKVYEQLGTRAAGQHGVFSRTDARSLGIADSTLDDAVAIGRFQSLAPAVFAVAGTAASRHQQLAACVMSFPSLAAASHQAAADLWGLTNRGLRNLEVVTTRWDRVHRPGIKVHESLDLIPGDVVQQEGIPVTTPVRTIVDLGASSRWLVESALENGIRRSLFSLYEVEVFVTRVARRGRRGVGVVRPLLQARRRWDSATESVLEDEFRKLVANGRVQVPTTQFVVRDQADRFVCRADFAYPDARLLIELDSEAHHLDRMAFRRDRSKQNRAVVLGWTILRYTWWDIQEEPFRVLAELRAALEDHR